MGLRTLSGIVEADKTVIAVKVKYNRGRQKRPLVWAQTMVDVSEKEEGRKSKKMKATIVSNRSAEVLLYNISKMVNRKTTRIFKLMMAELQ